MTPAMMATLSGIGGTAVSGGAMIGAASAAGNLGGYAVAQTLFSGGPALSMAIASLGGPLVAGGLLAGLIGLLTGGLALLLRSIFCYFW